MAILTIKEKIKEYIKLIYICPEYKKILNNLEQDKEAKIILIGTPAHGNLGDQAIAISELDFLRKISDGRKTIEIPMPLYKVYRKFLQKHIGCNDTIIISGGGWMGNLWMHNEITIREIISDYINNKIIIFPQTLYYTNDADGRETADDTKRIFEKHTKLLLTVRDLHSFEFAKSNLGLPGNGKLLFCPDMALFGTLSYSTTASLTNKKKALLCFRNDIEKVCSSGFVRDTLKKAGFEIKETTTVLDKLVPLRKRKQIVKEKIKEFGEASIVVTDRLHAMIFSLLAGTPCFAFNNATGKVFGVGQYLERSGMPVYLIDKMEMQMLEHIEIKKTNYNLPAELRGHFLNLADRINQK